MAVVMVGPGITIFTTPIICVRYDHHVMAMGALEDTALDMDYCQLSYISTRSVHIVLARPGLLRGWCRLSPLAGWKPRHICWLAPAVSSSGVSIGIWPPLADGLRHSAGSGS